MGDELRAVTLRVDQRRRKLISQLMAIYPIVPVGSGAAGGVGGSGTGVGSTTTVTSASGAVTPTTKDKTDKISGGRPLFMIREVPLPNAQLSGMDDEQISTALGYVTHVVFMLSKILCIPMRYKLVYRASRSAVCDEVQSSFAQFPLFSKGVEERRFECALILLNKNIEHLLNARVEDWRKLVVFSQNTLENLDILLQHEVPR